MSVLIAKDEVREPLFAVVPVSNPWRWKSRYKHTDRAIKHFIDSGCIVYLVEVAFNRREFVYADAGLEDAPVNCRILNRDPKYKHKYIPLRSASELWLKENQVNIGVQHLPYDWEQVAWLDADVHFVRPNWVGECIHRLQHYSFLQMFSQARDLAPNYEMLPEDYPHASGVSFIYHHMKEGFPDPRTDFDIHTQVSGILDQSLKGTNLNLTLQLSAPNVQPYPPPRVFPGLAWAATRRAWDDVGGLLDMAIWGGADYHMAHCLIEKTEMMMRDDLHRNYKKMVMQWYHRCRTHIRQNVGYMEGVIFHAFHGRKSARGYNSKHSLLAKAGFDPLRHLKRDFQGLWALHDDRSNAFPKIRDMMRAVAHDRDEDSNDTRLDLWEQGH